MNQSSGVPDRDQQQIVLLLDGQLSDAEMHELAERISSSEQLRDAYVRYAKLHAMLGWCHGAISRRTLQDEVNPVVIAELLVEAEQLAQQKAADEAAKIAAEAARAAALRREIERLERRNRQRSEPIVVPYSVLYLSVAAIAASLLWFSTLIFQPNDLDVATIDRPAILEDIAAPKRVATVVSAVEAGWDDPEIACDPGTRLPAQQLVLTEGIIQIRFDGGAEAVIEAPADLELLLANRVRVLSGKIVGKVPPEAVGFTVETPSTEIIDLGTEFGVQVDSGGDVQVHVFDGEVTATIGENAEPDLLTEGEAVEVDAETHGVSLLELQPTQFVRRLPPIIEYVGVHESVGEFLRTTTVEKPLDVDGDNVFGTAGFYFFNSNNDPGPVKYVGPFENMLYRKPSFVNATAGFVNGISAGDGVYTVLGMPEYLDIDDPHEPAGPTVANVNSGILSYDIMGSHGVGNPQSASEGSEIELCRIAIGEGVFATGFRLGLFVDNGDLESTVIGGVRVSIDDQEQYVEVGSRNLDGDVHLFDVMHAQPGDVLTIRVLINAEYASIGGLTFDVPATQDLNLQQAIQ